MPKVALHTLGCKVNQYESHKIAQDFRSRGFELVDFSDTADIYVINSCTVTHTADSKSRQAARAAIHRNPRATVVLTGCYAETSQDEAAAIGGISMVIGNREKDRLVDRVLSRLSGPAGLVNLSALPHEEICSPGSETRNRTRATLKVQDGCDQFCSYCAVPFARPIMSSKPAREVIAEAEELANCGYKEIVLTGIRLGRYEDGGTNLAGLLERMAGVDGIERIRLSSIELTDIPKGLLDLMAADRKICRHLHIPLQSGDDGVLARMNRPYTSKEFALFVNNARALVPGIAITTDIMVGFPGETAEEFENTCTFAEEIRFARAHIFRYSPRPRTAAAGISGEVTAAEKERRSARLISLAADRSQEFASTLIGRTVPVLIEGKEIGGRMRSGLTDNYVRVTLEADSRLVGKIVNVRIEGASNGIARGRLKDGDE